MEYTVSNHEILQGYAAAQESDKLVIRKKSLIANLIQWATDQDEKNHIGWVGLTITVMAAVFFPVTMSVVLFNGAVFGLIITAMIALALVVITNLAAMSTRYTIPFFCLGVLIDLAVIVASFYIK